MNAERRPAEAASGDLVAETRSTIVLRPVCSVRLAELSSPHDIAAELWYRTAALRAGTTVRLEVGKVWPPRFIPDVRTDVSYAIDTDRGDIADAWAVALQRGAAMAVLA